MSKVRALGVVSIMAMSNESMNYYNDIRNLEGKNTAIFIPQHKKPRTKAKKRGKR